MPLFGTVETRDLVVAGVTISDSEATALQGVTGILETRLNALESMVTPVITLNGGPVFVRKDAAYVEPGATASALGGTVEVMPSSINISPATVDTAVVGSVEITYTVASVSVKRTVTVFIGGVISMNVNNSAASTRPSGTYAGISPTGGAGSGLLVDVLVAVDGSISSVTIVNEGMNYQQNETLTISDSDLGGTQAVDVTLTISAVSA